MELTLITDLDKAWSIASAWRRLSMQRPFESPEWMLTWWKHYGAGTTLSVIVCRDRQTDEIVGIAPLLFERRTFCTKWRFLGSGAVCSDYLRILARPGREAEVYRSIATFIQQQSSSHTTLGGTRLDLEGVLPTETWCQDLLEKLQAQGFRCWSSSLPSSVSLGLPCSWDAWLKSLPSEARRKAKRIVKRVDEHTVEFQSASSPVSIHQSFDELIRLHQARRNSLGQVGCFHDSRFGGFLRETTELLAHRGQAVIEWCQDERGIFACHLLFQEAETVFMYQSGIDPNRMDVEPGHTLTVTAIRRAISDRLQCYDFMRGEEKYKFYWGGQAHPLATLHCVPPQPMSRLWVAASMRFQQFKQLAKTIPSR